MSPCLLLNYLVDLLSTSVALIIGGKYITQFLRTDQVHPKNNGHKRKMVSKINVLAPVDLFKASRAR